MAYAGLGALGGGVVATIATIALAVAANNLFKQPATSCGEFEEDCLSNHDEATLLAADAVLAGIVAVAAYVAGGVLTGIGFHRAGPTVKLDWPEAVVPGPVGEPPSAPPPPPLSPPPPPPSI